MKPTRVRIRFAKAGDLRMISHRDLVRAFERLFRRAGVSLAMSQGFHPRPVMTFPDALALGIAAENEVMDLTLTGKVDPQEFEARLVRHSPPGLVIKTVRLLGDDERKAKIDHVVYELKIPPDTDVRQLQEAIASLRVQSTLIVERRQKRIEIPLRETLDELCLDHGRLIITIRVVQQSQLQPRDILAAIGLPNAIREGAVLTRTRIELLT